MFREFTRPAQRPAVPGALAAAVPALLWAIDTGGVYTLAAGKGLSLLPDDIRPATGRSAATLFSKHPGFHAHVRRGLSGEAFSAQVELAGRTFESRYEPLRSAEGAVIGLAGVLTDITEQHANEDALFHAQKMASLGLMAGSVAHDFNNLLMAILGFAGLLKQTATLDARDSDHLYLIEQAARRGADIASRLLAFARGGMSRFAPLDLRNVVTEAMALVRPTLNDRITIDIDLPPSPVIVDGDFGQLQQALLNIVWNARDVLSEGGNIWVRLAQAGSHAQLSVSDSGPGIPADVRARLFDPFFTTKPAGSGTGLGLSIAYGVARGHHGDIVVTSEPGHGATFVLNFPLHVEGPAEDLSPDSTGDLVLVVDDDDLVRRATSSALTTLGYSVVEVHDGALAVELVRARPGRFAAILLDLVMPGLAGRDVFSAVKTVCPELPVIVCTGYAAAGHLDEDMRRSISGLLQKPFNPDRLAAALRAVGVTAAPRPALAAR